MRIETFLEDVKKNEVDISDHWVMDRYCAESKLEFASGASRLCVVFPKEKKVLKIPRHSVSIDYCAREMENYKLAEKYGVEKILLPIEYYTTVNGTKVYIQPMYSCAMCEMPSREKNKLNDKISNLSGKEIIKKVQRGVFESKWRTLDHRWTARVVQLYGKKFARSFEEWTQEAKVNDLHSYNIGWLDKKPIVLDYAGYYENRGSLPF